MRTARTRVRRRYAERPRIGLQSRKRFGPALALGNVNIDGQNATPGPREYPDAVVLEASPIAAPRSRGCCSRVPANP